MITTVVETAEEIGHLLGYPDCCIDRFVQRSTEFAAIKRGSITERARGEEEIARLLADLPTGFLAKDLLYKRYVPCEHCMGEPGWQPWPYPSQREQ